MVLQITIQLIKDLLVEKEEIDVAAAAEALEASEVLGPYQVEDLEDRALWRRLIY